MAITKTVKVDAKLLEGYRIEMHAGPLLLTLISPKQWAVKTAPQPPGLPVLFPGWLFGDHREDRCDAERH